jgi:enoyl-CoA hydratase/carnithine racemase
MAALVNVRSVGDATIICLDRPAALNALTLEMVTALTDAYTEDILTHRAHRPFHVAVLKGAGSKVKH